MSISIDHISFLAIFAMLCIKVCGLLFFTNSIVLRSTDERIHMDALLKLFLVLVLSLIDAKNSHVPLQI